MKIDTSSNIPIFLQIADQLENMIFTNIFKEEDRIPSTNELSLALAINPQTVLKGMNILVEADIIYKKRGVGMFVKEGALDKIYKKRKKKFKKELVHNFISEAKILQISKQELLDIIKEEF